MTSAYALKDHQIELLLKIRLAWKPPEVGFGHAPTIRWLAGMLWCSTSTVQYQLNKLRDFGFVTGEGRSLVLTDAGRRELGLEVEERFVWADLQDEVDSALSTQPQRVSYGIAATVGKMDEEARLEALGEPDRRRRAEKAAAG